MIAKHVPMRSIKKSDFAELVKYITDEQGNEVKILRDNMPFATPGRGEYGTYFIGYAKDPSVTEEVSP